jgi:hypothetical protein
VGRRSRQRSKLAAQQDHAAEARSDEPGRRASRAAASDYRDSEGNTLALRGSLTPKARQEYAAVLAGGLDLEDASQRALELLFERLAVSWTIAGLQLDRQKELLGRYRVATGPERQFVRDALREHVGENFPDLQAP